ncbi:MAG: DNA polymerase III subunit beta [Bacteriovoracaceae bacterium]|nr:DNA polymerase III subunit beta [Bacteriovoracaceae bacterium]
MKIQIQSDKLRDALNKILTVVDRKNSRPILTNCLINVDNNSITLIASDLEVSSRIIIPAITNGKGSFCINSKNFFDIVRELPDSVVDLEIQNSENLLKLNCQSISYSLLITSSEEYPHLLFENHNNEFKVRTKEIIDIINKTSHAISTDETRLYLNGIFLQLVDNKLRSVAIDGHRLALLDTTEFLGDCKALVDGVIIPKKGITELRKIAESYPESDLKISVDESFMYINAQKEYDLSIRLIAREYPKYQSVIPSKTSFSMQVDKGAVLDAVKRIRLLSNEKTNGIKFLLKASELEISANHPSLGKAREVLPVAYAGNQFEIGFNAKYLMDTLSVFSDTEIKFEFNNELSPVAIKSETLPEFLGIIMPLKL